MDYENTRLLSSEQNKVIQEELYRRTRSADNVDVESVLLRGFGGIFPKPVFSWFDQYQVKQNQISLFAAGTRLAVAKTNLLFIEKKMISLKLMLFQDYKYKRLNPEAVVYENDQKKILLITEDWKGYQLPKVMSITMKPTPQITGHGFFF